MKQTSSIQQSQRSEPASLRSSGSHTTAPYHKHKKANKETDSINITMTHLSQVLYSEKILRSITTTEFT